MTFERDNDLVNWAYANPEAAQALIDGKAAVLSLDTFGEVDAAQARGYDGKGMGSALDAIEKRYILVRRTNE